MNCVWTWFCGPVSSFLSFLYLLSYSRRKFRYKQLSRSTGDSFAGVQQPGTETHRDGPCKGKISPATVTTNQDGMFAMLNSASYQTRITKKSSLQESDSAHAPKHIIHQVIPTSENVSVTVTGESRWKARIQQPPISETVSVLPLSSGLSQGLEGLTTHLQEVEVPDGASTFLPPNNLPQIHGLCFSKVPASSTSSTPEVPEPCLMQQSLDRYSTNLLMPEIDSEGVETEPMYTPFPERRADEFTTRSVDGPIVKVKHGDKETCNCSRIGFGSDYLSGGAILLSPADWQVDHKQESEKPAVTLTVPVASPAPRNFHEETKVRQQVLPSQGTHAVYPLVPTPVRNIALRDTVETNTRHPNDVRVPSTSSHVSDPSLSVPLLDNTSVNVPPFTGTTSSHWHKVQTKTEALVPRKKRKLAEEVASTDCDQHNELYTDNSAIYTPTHVSSHEFGFDQNPRTAALRKQKEKMLDLEEYKLPSLSAERPHSPECNSGKNDELAVMRSTVGPPRTRVEDLPPSVQASLTVVPASNDTCRGDRVNCSPVISASESVKLRKRGGRAPQSPQRPLQSTGQFAPSKIDPVGSSMLPSFVAASGSITHSHPRVREESTTATLTPTPLPPQNPQPFLQCTAQSVPPKTNLVCPAALVAASGSIIRSITPPRPKVREKPTTAIFTPTPLQKEENGVPIPIPDEMRALIDAYVKCIPVGVFATEAQIKGFWGLDLARKEEFGCSFMGFYRVSRIWECLGEREASTGTNGSESRGLGQVDGTITARVHWKFRMKWEPGGEDWQTVGRDDLSSPWWNPSLKAKGLSAVSQPELEDSDEESTETYRLARRRNPNFPRRHCFFSQSFFSVLPLHLLAPGGVEMPDSSLPRGWYCQDCGKLNFRYHLRHWQCRSSYCKVCGAMYFLIGIETD